MPDGERGRSTTDWVDTTAGGEADGGSSVGTEELGGPITDPRIGETGTPGPGRQGATESDLGGVDIGGAGRPGAGLGQTRGGGASGGASTE